MTEPEPPEEYLKATDVADIFGVTPVTIKDWCKTGKLPNWIKPGRAYLIPRSDIKALIESSYGASTQP